jgi:hypothetical protein
MSRRSPVLRRLPVLLALVLVLAACSGKSVPVAQPTVSSDGQASPSNCPSPANTSFRWPAGIPANFPKPPGGRVVSTQTGENGLRIVRLATPLALRQGILFVLTELPRAGYRLGRGDAEASEADAPFQSADVRGVVRVIATAKSCETTWLVAVAGARPSGGTPFAPFPRPSASPSLPFG